MVEGIGWNIIVMIGIILIYLIFREWLEYKKQKTEHIPTVK